jgi:hypothetical protein
LEEERGRLSEQRRKLEHERWLLDREEKIARLRLAKELEDLKRNEKVVAKRLDAERKLARLERSKLSRLRLNEYLEKNPNWHHVSMASMILKTMYDNHYHDLLTIDRIPTMFKFVNFDDTTVTPEVFRHARHMAKTVAPDLLLYSDSKSTLGEAWDDFEKLVPGLPGGEPSR